MRDGRALIRTLSLAALLFGPLVTAELWARRQVDLLYPSLAVRTSTHWIEAKLLLLEDAGCPRVLALGSSMTNHAFVEEALAGRELHRGGRSESLGSYFDFGVNGARATMMYGVWRQLQRRGCTPEDVFLEVSPTTLNGKAPWRGGYRAVLDASTLSRMPDGFVAHSGFTVVGLLDLVTIERLVVHRLRLSIVEALTGGPAERPRDLRLDSPQRNGQISKTRTGSVGVGRLEEEFASQRARRDEGRYEVSLGEIEIEATRKLVAEATAAGARVVLHTPPVSPIYHAVMDEDPEIRAFRDLDPSRLTRPAPAAQPVVWLRCYGGDFSYLYFSDWIHLNLRGARRYLDELFAAVAGRRVGHPACPAPVGS